MGEIDRMDMIRYLEVLACELNQAPDREDAPGAGGVLLVPGTIDAIL